MENPPVGARSHDTIGFIQTVIDLETDPIYLIFLVSNMEEEGLYLRNK